MRKLFWTALLSFGAALSGCSSLSTKTYSYGADGKLVTETYPISNAREESAKRNRFLIEPAELMRGERYARERDLEVVGFYHSHPDSPAVPSQYDLEHAWPTYSYIIVSTRADEATDLFSWEQEPDRSRFNQEEITEV